MSNQLKNPIFWGLIAVLLGGGLLIWGAIKGDCSGPNCWVGSGFLKWAGSILLAGGIIGWFAFGNNRRS